MSQNKNIVSSTWTEPRWSGQAPAALYNHLISKNSVDFVSDSDFGTRATQYGNDFQLKAGVSFDSIFSPYSTHFEYTTASGLGHFEPPTTIGVPNSLTLNPFNPNNSLSLYYAPTGSLLHRLSSATTGAPTAAELALQSGAAGWMSYGHNIDLAVRGTGDVDE